ncbi:UPF0481 protein At3g47200-like isoform X2 [Pistacia vera]|uniref:UPF0481 protein At3g47200-like isoform X2 n=1 Tax=Pistacia vera TaxID=55513 RepID=UPI0012638C9E|nr:UPF0481 protein At3g47200-like isoform X2 [Pistacia vera]XP_031259645.1 UPF0481 protein At3g47200-like isoform X2 [Pistacia vera]XP_031259646.1 UPF0481 protein At3g47200-like isoform X2 [Pistacia vera]
MNGSGGSSEDKHQNEDEVIIDIKDNIERCIYRVPKKLRNINNDAYTPHIVSIGPYHHGKEKWDDGQSKKEWKWDEVESKKEGKWDDMQKLKKRYQGKFFKKILEKEQTKNFVEEDEQRIRACYKETFEVVKKEEQRIRACYEAKFEDFDSVEFNKMILDDAVFIIELFSRNYKVGTRDFFLSKPWLTNAVKLDLQLLENQLPYFVLKKLYKLAYGGVSPSFVTLSCKFFGYKEPAGKANWDDKIKHFVDLRRHTMLVNGKIDQNFPKSLRGKIEDLPSAVKLNESGVKFKSVENKDAVKTDESGVKSKAVENKDAVKTDESGKKSESDKENQEEIILLKIEFGKRERKDSCIPRLRGDVLKIPRLKIEDGTECLFRNLMALEQCHYPFETHICNYIDLMDALINTRKDVDLLVDHRIISNCVGDHDSIKEMFNRLCLEITQSTSCYKQICDGLKKHHDRWWNRTKATLISVYFENLWRGTGTVAATILLLLTLLQTIQRFYPELFMRKK